MLLMILAMIAAMQSFALASMVSISPADPHLEQERPSVFLVAAGDRVMPGRPISPWEFPPPVKQLPPPPDDDQDDPPPPYEPSVATTTTTTHL